MTRKLQFTLAQLMLAVLVIGYFCVFRELAVLLGIFLITILFLAPIPLGMWLLCRLCLGREEVRLFPSHQALGPLDPGSSSSMTPKKPLT